MITRFMGEPDPSGDKVYADEPNVSIRWVSEGGWVHVQWKAWADSAEYRAAHETILLAIRENHASKNLIDATHARVVSESDQKWLIDNWIPRAVAAGRRSTAVVMPRSALGRTISENIDKGTHSNLNTVEYFETATEAAAWLSTVN
jgi:hypothetical protein